jgi:hypothetical protein
MKQICFLFFVCFIPLFQLQAQGEEEFNPSMEVAFDKVYLHTDKPHYFLKDTIWVKAYAWSAVAGEGIRPSSSRTLYMALKNQCTGENMFQTPVLLEEGMGSAQLALNNIPAGDYVLLAQSKAMADWESEYIFQRPISVSEIGAVTLVRSSDIRQKPLPVPFQNGLRIGFNLSEGKYQLIIDRSKDQAESVFQLIALQQGKPIYEQILSLRVGKNVYKLDSDKFLPGLADFALVNERGDIVAERPVYFHPQAIPTLKISTNQQTYRPRERVQVLLNVLDEFGEALEADFSVSVVDSKQVSWPNGISTIVTEMELGAALGRDFDFSPQIFQQENSAKELNDLLAYEKSRSSLSNFNQQTERFLWEGKGLKLKGRATDKEGMPFSPGVELEFLIYPQQGGALMTSVKVGENGTFELEDLFFQGTAALVTRRIENTKKRTYSEVLESHQLTFEPLDLPKPTLQARFKPSNEAYSLNDIRRYALIRNNRWDERIVELDTFTVQRQVWTFGRNRDTNDFTAFANVVLDVPEGMFDHFNVFQYMQGRVPGMILIGNINDFGNPPAVFFRGSQMKLISRAQLAATGQTGIMGGGAAFLLDGVIVDPALIATIPMTLVKRIEIFNTVAGINAIGGSIASLGAVNVVSKQIDPKQAMFERNNVVYAQGYHQSIAFPKIEPGDLEKDLFKTNWNATLYWNPYLVTDVEGRGNFEFVLNDLQSELKIIVEGMSKTGQPIFGIHTILVEE